MSLALQHPLHELKERVAAIVREEDDVAFAELLAGRGLPALGGDLLPAEMVYRALTLPPVDRRLLDGAAGLTARLAADIDPEAEADELFDLVLFASFLPARSELFDALHRLHTLHLATGTSRVARQLRRALIHQQTDARLHDEWMAFLTTPSDERYVLTEEREDDLFDAWMGLLWIPPTDAERPFSAKRVADGLAALWAAVEDTPEALDVLREALRQLAEAWPSSAEFWVERLGPFFAEWDETLQDLVVEQWPLFGPETADAFVPDGMEDIWQAIAEEKRERLREISETGDVAAWNAAWQSLILSQDRPREIPQQFWIRDLRTIRESLEAKLSAFSQTRDDPSLAAIAEEEQVAVQADRRQGEPRRRVNSFALFQKVKTILTQVEQLIQTGDYRKAKKYIEELLLEQEEAGSEPRHRVKTLCNAAASALQAGEMAWSEDLYQRAIDLGVEDPVPRNGLAEVLKAQDKIQEAEIFYRETITRWPNDVVAQNGLAEILKAQDKIQEAENIYRETIKRWPQNVVAQNGLAEVLKAQGKIPEAENIYRETINRWPRDRVAPHGLANVLRKQKRFTEALALLPEVPRPVTQRDHYDLHLRAMILLESGDADKAIPLFERGLASNPRPHTKSVYRTALALAYLHRERFADARNALRDVADSPEGKILLFHAAAGEGDADEARRLGGELEDAKILALRPPARRAAERLREAFLDEKAEILRHPSAEELEAAYAAEVEMLLGT